MNLIVKTISQFKDDSTFGGTENNTNVMNLSNFSSNNLAICTEDEIWKLIDNYSSMSV